MPFFSQQSWMSKARRIWVWVVLTIPSTLLFVLFYFLYTRRNLAAGKKRPRADTEEDELDTLDSADDE